MYVTLLRDTPNLGRKDERVLVSDAYARNVLLPKKLASIGAQSALLLPKEGKKQFDAAKLAGIESKTFTISRKANEKNGLYKQVSEEDVRDTIARTLLVHAKEISLKNFEPIKNLGSRVIHAQFGGQYDKKITIDVKPE